MNSRFRSRVTVFLLLAALCVIAGVFLTACSPDKSSTSGAGKEKTFYTCGMHPQVIQDHPGNCPVCGMKLTSVRKPSSPGSASPGGTNQPAPESSTIEVDPVTIQNMGVRTATVIRGPLRRAIRTVGVIDYNETALADVTTKFKGWVEKLEVNATGQLVMQGDPLFEIYSPELYSAQREYLLALEQGTNALGGAGLASSGLTKLKFFDISDEQIAELQRTKQPGKTMVIRSPQDGFVVEKLAVQGQMVDPGMKLYRLADLGLVWVQAQIYERDLPFIKLGQEATVTLSYLPDREFRGRVTYVYPNVDEKTRTARVRMEFHNPGYFLKPGMFATVQVLSELEPSALLVPDMAILRSGEKTTVFVALEGGRFEPRTIALGPQSENDHYQVLSGLKEGERIVTSGQFMLDSESQLREAIQKMSNPRTASSAGPSNAPTLISSTADIQNPAAVKYICPMPEHVSIEYDHPGKCPICGMVLVPVSAATLKKLQPWGKLLYYTCPMPEHADVHSDKPGKCPKCGMTLIPIMQAVPITNALSPSSIDSGARPEKLSTNLYTCLMADHEIVTNKPGICPRCEMKLVPTSSVPHGKAAEEKWAKRVGR
jgi:multidrug efflux pump subunit AcrA (membrane-fusion protein)